MNDLATQPMADINSPDLKPDLVPEAPEVQNFSDTGVTLVEENLESGKSWFVLGPTSMAKIRQPLIGGREVWVEAQTVRFYEGEQGEPLRLIVVRNCSAEYEARTLDQKAIDRGWNHLQANLLVENLNTQTGLYVVRHARQSHQLRPLCAERRTEKMLPEEREAFIKGIS